MRSKTPIRLTLLLLFSVLTGYTYLKLTRFFAIEACLDAGICWDYADDECGCKDNNYGLDRKVLTDPRFCGGYDFVTRKPIPIKLFRFNDYTAVSGYTSDRARSSLGLFYKGKEIYYESSADGYYDTVLQANFNGDEIPDFLVSYTYEDGASWYGLLSSSTTTFSTKHLLDDWSDMYCLEGVDTLMKIEPLQLVDLNGDGKDDLIVNLVKINETVLAISCTDTVLAE